MDRRQAVLLHGHWQSGKTSALLFIMARAKSKGIKFYYFDMLSDFPTLQHLCLINNYSVYHFLASSISGLSPESLPNFISAVNFCRWIKERHAEDSVPPILLIDEYDSFLQVARKNDTLLVQMNSLISYNRNTQDSFSSIVCAGTFSIIATQTGSFDSMEIEQHDSLERQNSDDSIDRLVRPFDVSSPWNKATSIEAEPFNPGVFRQFAKDIYRIHNVSVSNDVVDDIIETTCGHPGFSMLLLNRSAQRALGRKSLDMADWMNNKRSFYYSELQKSKTMEKMLERLKSSLKIKDMLYKLVRDNELRCPDDRLVSFLRVVGVAKHSFQSDVFTFTCPIIRDSLIREFYPGTDTIGPYIWNPAPSNYLCAILLQAIPYVKIAGILDPLVTYSKGLAEAAFHFELYRILHSMVGSQVTILTETRVVSNSDQRCDIWMKTNLAEFGVELKTECDNAYIQKEANPQMIKYASTREPREMVFLNIVRKEADKISFPISIKPTGWDKYPKTNFNVLFVKLIGDIQGGVRYCYALNGDHSWKDLN